MLARSFMLSLAAEGLGSKWMTGALGVPGAKILEACGAGAKEHFMGVVWYGVPAEPTAAMAVPKRKTGIAEPVFSKLP